MILIDGGYIEAGKYYYYLTDHLGNNRVVADAKGNIVQKTHYEPFGKAFEEEDDAKDEEGQPYLYNGKELYSKHGLNLYDYHARLYSPEGWFSTQDPKAEKFYPWSPYVYCYNNPMKFVDPDGKQGRPARGARDLTRHYNMMRNGRGNPRYATAYPSGVRPPSTRTTTTFVGVPGANLRRQPLPASPIENHETSQGTVQVSRGNDVGKALASAIDVGESFRQFNVQRTSTTIYTENGPKNESSYNIQYSDPLQQAKYEYEQNQYEATYSSKVSELEKEGNLSPSEIQTQVNSEIGASPFQKVIFEFLIKNIDKVQVIDIQTQNIPEFRQK